MLIELATHTCHQAALSHVQVLEAADGAQAAGWPAFHKSKVHASPLLHDVDGDGVQDILVATYDGQILAFRDTVRATPPAGLQSCRNDRVSCERPCKKTSLVNVLLRTYRRT